MADGPSSRPGAPTLMMPNGARAKATTNVAILQLLANLRAAGRAATDVERQILARWSGWGALPGVFDPDNADLADVRSQVRALLDDDAWTAARRTTVNAHYTPADVIVPMWDAAVALGFTGGRVLEPGCGAGGFIGHAPDMVMSFVGVELDPTTAEIARRLYPTADIRCEGFETTRLPAGYFDLAVGNVPFGKYVVHDPKHNPNRRTIHNAFIIKSLRLTRPGGLVLMVTSRYTLDSSDTGARRDMAELADLVGAARLPVRAMSQAGTDVSVDVLVFRRTDTPSSSDWVDVVDVDTPDGPVRISRYFAEHPEMILGTLGTGRGMYRDGELEVRPDGRDLRGALGTALASLTAAPVTPAAVDDPPPPATVAGEREVITLFDLLDEPVAVIAHQVDEALDADVAAQVDEVLDPIVEPPTPAYPRREADGTLVWACCESTIGPPCAHRAAPAPAPTPAPAVEVEVEVEPVAVEAIDVSRYREGSIVPQGDGFVRIVDGIAEPFTPTAAKDAVELRLLCELRDTVMQLLDAQLESSVDAYYSTVQAHLNDLYDRYVAKFGPIGRYSKARTGRTDDDGNDIMRIVRPRMGGFPLDPAYRTVLALEVFDPEEQTARKAAIFSKRVVGPSDTVDRADTPADALALCLDEFGRVHLPRIADLLGCTADEARAQLGTLVWDDPVDGLVTAAVYLSGNVRAKLAEAEAAAERDPRFEANVAALREVMPADLGPGEIDVRLGAPWLEVSDIRQFVIEELKPQSWAVHNLEIDHASVTATWEVRLPGWARNTVEMTSRYGTRRADAISILHSSLNQTAITVYDKIDTPDGERRVINQDETLLAREKQEALGERFREWVWEDPARADRIVREYNERFNSHVVPAYDGSHIRARGLSLAFNPHPQQLNGAWRIMQDPSVLLAHPVGAGKTATMAIAAMEMRRLGLVKRPCMVVPNHMLDQFTSEFLQLYPLADVLVPTKDDMTPGGRKGFVARCAMSDADAVILTHSQFERIPVSGDTHRRFIGAKIAEFERAIDESRQNGGGLSVKKLEAAKLRLEERMQRLLDADAKDDGVTFEQTGIDYVFVDESQAFKNLTFPTKMQSVGGQGSKRASDLEIKLAYLRGRHDRFATFATATPIANTIAEMFVVQSYLQPEMLDQAGIGSFDAWAATFGSTVTALELAPDGGSYRMHTRFARFHNVPELITMFRLFADVRTKEELAIPVPAVEGGRAETVVVEPTPELREFVETLVERAEDIRHGRVRPEEDNMLVVCNDGRRAALDLRLVGMAAGGGKLDVVADRIVAEWRRHAHRSYLESDGTPSPHNGGFQLVFCDLSTPRQEWNVYDELRRLLVARGMDAHRIRFIHEARDNRQKEEMFAACRAGRVDVLVGSTGKMGVGTNVQTRLTTLHHIDCPWRPDEIEQRDGRGIRQGNQNAEVTVVRYATEGSFDVYMWQTVERKAKFIYQVMSGQVTAREVDDVGEAALSYAEIKALATGNPLIMEKAGVDMEVARLKRLRAAHASDQARMASRIRDGEARLPRLRARLELAERAIARRQPYQGDAFAMQIGDTIHTDRADAAWALRDELERHLDMGATDTVRTIGSFAGFEMTARVHRPILDIVVEVELVDAPLGVSMTRTELKKDPVRSLLYQLEKRMMFEHVLDDVRQGIVDVEADVDAARTRLGEAFPQEAKLAELVDRQAHIERELEALEEHAA